MSVLQRLRQLSENSRQTNTLDRINEYLEKSYNAPRPYKATPSHAPSSLGTRCLRKIYYAYWKLAIKKPTSAKSARIFRTGDYYEEMLVEWLKAIGEHIPYRNKGNGKIPKSKTTGLPDPQFPIKSEKFRIRRGYIDNVGITNKELWLYEIKSSKEEKFKPLKEPMDSHKVQAGIYLHAFNEMLIAGEFDHIEELRGFKKAVGVRYLYVNKDNTDIKMFDWREADFASTMKTVKNRLTKVNKAIDLKELPKKTKDGCYFCDFSNLCGRDWNDIIEEESEKP